MTSAYDLTVATLNLWGLNEPWAYMAHRGEVRGAAPGSSATTLRVPGGVWAARRRLLTVRALRECGADIIGLQESRVIQGAGGRESQAKQLAQGLSCYFASLDDETAPGSGRGESSDSSNGNAVLSRHPIA